MCEQSPSYFHTWTQSFSAPSDKSGALNCENNYAPQWAEGSYSPQLFELHSKHSG